MTSILIEKLIYFRKQSGLSQKDIANRMGITQSALSKIENQTFMVGTELMSHYAKALGMKLDVVKEKMDDFSNQDVYEIRHFDTPLIQFRFSYQKDGSLQAEILRVNYNQASLFPKDIVISPSGIIEWLSTRTIPKNRAFVYEILSSLGLQEGDIKGIIDLGMGLSVNDSYWIVKEGFEGKFDTYNLYENHFNDALSLAAWTGNQSSIRAFTTSPELTTNGMLAKAWRLQDDGLRLYKAGTEGFSNSGREPYCEAYAYQVGKAMGLDIVPYHLEKWKGKLACVCPAFTSKTISYMPIGRLVTSGGMYAVANFYKQLGADCYDQFCSMVVFDALIANEDRHFGNFGVLIDSTTNQIIGPAPLFDHGLGLLYAIPKDQMRSIDSVYAYSLTRKSCFGTDFFTQAANYIGAHQKEQLRHVLNFKFEEEAYNLPKRYLTRLEKTIQKRARMLLQLPSREV